MGLEDLELYKSDFYKKKASRNYWRQEHIILKKRMKNSKIESKLASMNSQEIVFVI